MKLHYPYISMNDVMKILKEEGYWTDLNRFFDLECQYQNKFQSVSQRKNT